MSDLKAVRKHTASHDLFNRIHSIAADETFVKHIAREVYNDRFEVVRKSSSPWSILTHTQRTSGAGRGTATLRQVVPASRPSCLPPR